MLKRRRLILFGLLAVAIMLVGIWMLRPRTAITRENAAQIEIGMTLCEVESLLGGPERIDTTGPTEGDDEADGGDGPERLLLALTHITQTRRSRLGTSKHTWGSDSVAIFVVFDADQRVIDVAVRPLRRAPESPVDMLRRWLGM